MKVVKKKIDNYEVLEYKGTNIYVIENILDDLTCEEFISFIEKLDLNDTSEEPDKLLKCKYLNLLNNNPTHSIIDFKIYSIFNKIFEIMTKCNPYINITGDTYYILRKIYGETQLHTDEVRAIHTNYFFNQIRCLAAVIALNDNFEGGVFKFPHQNIEHKMKKGSVILFPPFWTHPHQITTVGENQYRYTITTWGTENIINK
jgi:hypothetical protein